MDSKIIDGRKLALKHEEVLRAEIIKLKIKPKLISIIVGDDPPSLLYTNIKQKKAAELGIIFEPLYFSFLPLRCPHELFDEVADKIIKLNNDPLVHGIMVQLPLPEEFLQGRNEKELLQLINPEKDVDGLNYARKAGLYVPAAVKAVLSILKDENISVLGKRVVAVGSSDLVGKPMTMELEKLGGLVTVCDRKTLNLREETLEAQILISATGVPHLINGGMVSENVVVIDVGAEKVDGKLVGDVNFQSVYPKASRITPVPGGVGPMTVISLMENVVEAVNVKA